MLVNHLTKQGARRSDYSVSDYLCSLVGDFIRGKKLQKGGRRAKGTE